MKEKRVSDENIIEALKVIQEICIDNVDSSNCKKCPIFSDKLNTCLIAESSPANWNILEYKKFQAME